jgi:hypothetical protein
MKLIKKQHSDKNEDKNIEPFLYDIFPDRSGVTYEAIPVEMNKTPDYLIDKDIFIEVKQLHDGVDTERSAQWGKITHKLQKFLSNKFKSENIRGLYSIETPNIFKLNGDKKYNQVVFEIIDGIKTGKNVVNSCGISFKIEKVNDKCNEVYLVAFSGASTINPSGTIFQNIGPKLQIANTQLGYSYQNYQIRRRIVLIVNKYMFADRISEIIEGLSYCYDDLLSYENIDEIWFQQGTKGSKPIHTKICDHNFLKEFENGQINPELKENQEQFQLWYWALEKMESKKPQLWDAMKNLLDKYKPEDIFDDPYKRQEMTRLGLWLLEQKKDCEAIWLINKFINDPSPGEPIKYSGDERFDYHKQLERGNDPTIITTVMGHLAWTVQALARKSSAKEPTNLIEAFKFTEYVLKNTSNLYVVQQWLVPLIEIANRRWWLLEHDANLYKSFRALLLTKKNGLVAKYGKVPGITKYMVHIFNGFKDLTTEEAKLVLVNLSEKTRDIASVLIYFAVFRQNHYKKGEEYGSKAEKINPDILSYDPQFAINRLEQLINESDNADLLGTIAWNFWKIATDSQKEYKNVAPWIDKMFSSRKAILFYDQLKIVLTELINKHPKDCLIWLDKLIVLFEDNSINNEFKQIHYIYFPEVTKWLKNNMGKKGVKELVSRLETLREKGFSVY